MRGPRVALFLAFRQITRGNKATTALIILVVSLAYVNLLFISSILGGIVDTLNKQVINTMFSNIVIEPQEEPTKKDFIVRPNELQQQIENIPGVVATARRYKFAGTIAYDKERKGEFRVVPGEIVGIDPEQEKRVTTIARKVIDGQYLIGLGKGDILLGADLAGGPGASSEVGSLGGVNVGDKVHVTFSNGTTREYKVKGIFRAQFDIADRMAFITVREAESVLSVSGRASQILVKIGMTGTEDYYINQIRTLAPNLKIRKWADYVGALGDISKSFDVITFIVSAVGLAAAAITMFVLIYVNVVNRKRQIGILKAIGIKQNIIVYSYMLQALFYGSSGVIIGLVLVTYLVAPYFVTHPLSLPIGETSLSLTSSQVIYGAFSLLVAAFVAGLLPSWRATSVVYYKCLYSSVIPELDLESMFIPLDSSLRWNDINILDASRYIRDTTLEKTF